MAYERLISPLIDWAKEKLKGKEEVVALLKRFGYERPENNFESIYVHCLVALGDKHKEQLAAVLRDEGVIAAFRNYWTTQEFAPFSRQFAARVEALKQCNYVMPDFDIQAELKGFTDSFRDLVWRVATPTEQEQTALLNDLREALQGPPLGQQLQSVVDALWQRCRREGMLVTRLHLFEALAIAELESLPSLRAPLDAVLRDLRPLLHADALRKDGFRVTDAVLAAIARARQHARTMGLGEVGLDRAFQAMLDHPGEDIETLLRRHGIAAAELKASLGVHTPRLVQGN
jgi:hypothetical protein